MSDKFARLNQDEKNTICSFLPMGMQLLFRSLSRQTQYCTQPLVLTLLHYVIYGLQNKAEALLKLKPELALGYGDIRDQIGRMFPKVTPLQLALCNLDWSMWRMLVKYLPPEAIKDQVVGFVGSSECQTLQEEMLVDWCNLITEYQIYIDMHADHQRGGHQWVKTIGGLQRRLPIHLLQEYCHPMRNMSPCPNFAEPFYTRIDLRPSWVCILGGLGERFALLRGDGRVKRLERVATESMPQVFADSRALAVVVDVRLKQRDDLVNQYCKGVLKIYPTGINF
jgi:hypothetical protein